MFLWLVAKLNFFFARVGNVGKNNATSAKIEFCPTLRALIYARRFRMWINKKKILIPIFKACFWRNAIKIFDILRTLLLFIKKHECVAAIKIASIMLHANRLFFVFFENFNDAQYCAYKNVKGGPDWRNFYFLTKTSSQRKFT